MKRNDIKDLFDRVKISSVESFFFKDLSRDKFRNQFIKMFVLFLFDLGFSVRDFFFKLSRALFESLINDKVTDFFDVSFET